MWYELKDTSDILSPALLVGPQLIEENIDQMLAIAGGADRLRPHIKTYKTAQIIKMQQVRGIDKFKCATYTEAELLGASKAKDVLWAMPLVGANQKAFLHLISRFPNTQFSVLVDHQDQVRQWENLLTRDQVVDVFIDVNMGMDRTGVSIDAFELLYRQINGHTQLNLRGLHCYDGHIHDSDPDQRKKHVSTAFQDVELRIENKSIGEWVCGGSITFPIHADDPRKTLSPGTTLLWDAGYGRHFADLPFQVAAVLLTRVISKPAANVVCLDLGHKSVAAEMPQPRMIFPQIDEYEILGQSEEHLTLQIKYPDQLAIGQVLYAIPWHICPTVALHEQMLVVQDQRVSDTWQVAARKRNYQI